jgi:hypothetical protein
MPDFLNSIWGPELASQGPVTLRKAPAWSEVERRWRTRFDRIGSPKPILTEGIPPPLPEPPRTIPHFTSAGVGAG